jgi:hypothetical protein
MDPIEAIKIYGWEAQSVRLAKINEKVTEVHEAFMGHEIRVTCHMIKDFSYEAMKAGSFNAKTGRLTLGLTKAELALIPASTIPTFETLKGVEKNRNCPGNLEKEGINR